MNKRYNEYCMKFSNEELKRFLYDKLFENNIHMQCLSADGEGVDITSNTKIETIAFDEKENISIMFFGWQTSVFAYDVEIMFIDEDMERDMVSSM